MLIFANCQRFDLTANRNNIRTDQEEYDLAVKGIEKFAQSIWDSSIVKTYFDSKKQDEKKKKIAEDEKEAQERKERAQQTREDRLNGYKGRAKLVAPNITGVPIKEPRSEAETALLLQAMISSEHPGINFVIGDYNTAKGVDLIIEEYDKGIPTIKWAELVSSLDKLFQWPHPPEGYHCIICYQLGDVKEVQKFSDGQEAKLVKKGTHGRYTLVVGSDSIEVYVLREILSHS